MELKANELRIGNKLLFLGDVVTFKNITEIREDGIFWIKTFEPKIESKNFHFKPIPLTEELILKYGKNSIFSNGYSYRITKLGRVEILLGVAIITVIDYLHEFQNLNFALLGCEIEEYEPLY